MTWKAKIAFDNPVWYGIQEYAQERIADLTTICTTPESNDLEIRQAQAGIAELRRLLSMPSILSGELQVRSQPNRKEY